MTETSRFGQSLTPPPTSLANKVVRGWKPPKHLKLEGKVLRAAWMIADARMIDADIAEQLRISRQTLFVWRLDDAFMAQIATYREEINRAILSYGSAVKENRIRDMQERLDRMRALVAARAVVGEHRAARNAGDPGENTGIIAEAPAGRTTIMATDHALLREIRELEKQIAMELGQFQQKVDVTTGGQSIAFTIPMSDNVDNPIEVSDDSSGGE